MPMLLMYIQTLRFILRTAVTSLPQPHFTHSNAARYLVDGKLTSGMKIMQEGPHIQQVERQTSATC